MKTVFCDLAECRRWMVLPTKQWGWGVLTSGGPVRPLIPALPLVGHLIFGR